MHSRIALRHFAVGIALLLVLTACSSATPTAAPTPTPTAIPTAASTSTPTAIPTAAPTPTPVATIDFTTSVADILTHWRDTQGFTCDASAPSSSVGYNEITCAQNQANGFIYKIALFSDEMTGKLGAGVATVSDPSGNDLALAAAVGHLDAFVTSLLGTSATPVLTWLGVNLGAAGIAKEIPNLIVATGAAAGGNKSGLFVAIGTAAFDSAPQRVVAPTATPIVIPTPSATDCSPVNPLCPGPSADPGQSWTFSRDQIVKAFTDDQAIVFDATEHQSSGETYVQGADAANKISVAIYGASGAAAVTAVAVGDAGTHDSETAMGYALGLMLGPDAGYAAGTWAQGELDKAYTDKTMPVQDTEIFGSASVTFVAWPLAHPGDVALVIQPATAPTPTASSCQPVCPPGQP